jgi:hypothetical protein
LLRVALFDKLIFIKPGGNRMRDHKKYNRQKTKRIFNHSYYNLALQLYQIDKKGRKKEARLPLNDFRRRNIKKKRQELPYMHRISLKNVLLRIAALW